MHTQQLPQTRYSDAELAEFKVIIDAKLSEARRQLQFYLDQLSEQTNSEDGKLRGLDDGVGTMVNEETHRLASRQQQLIQHLENALLRIENKVYGICRATGELISAERLRIVPHTTLSIHAKQNR
ncbi:TraR/DksA C4-type zinc finger protein [Lewinella sp. JB7]|uniref:TraR/DksA family transcriptional regulator n=1 Tax=Lewinella sp. JB7 TaxID=2962887 RepID=UPI0020CA21A1|nr:TraR/DksA C4-type zinc finger protein [Lewinella sp. JB7]MCP9236878.1 TraR/DksA C4-type zinc finger protein [Lewinella sp. JB7]